MINRPPEYLIGVDLGQAHDHTAIAVLERTRQQTGRTTTQLVGAWGDLTTKQVPQLESIYQVRHLDRLPLGSPYPEQVEAVGKVLQAVQAAQREEARDQWRSRRETLPEPRLIVDQTGVGRPVVDMLKQAGHKHLTAVTIHGGDATTREGSSYRVPKRELVSVLQVLLQTKRLTVASALKHARTLTREMLAFKVTITSGGHDSYGNDWRENPHDDLVLAVALAVWAGDRTPGRPNVEALRRASGPA